MFSERALDPARFVLSIPTVTGISDRSMPRLKVKVSIEYAPSTPPQGPARTGRAAQWIMEVVQHELEISDGVGPLATSGLQHDVFQPLYLINKDYVIPIPRYVLQSLEQKRRDDLTLHFKFGGLCLESELGKTATVYPFSFDLTKEFSQAQWTKLLREMGYEDVWVIEMVKPPITPNIKFNEAQRLLDEAQKELIDGSPDQVVTKCRQSIELLLDSLTKEEWEKIRKEVDAGPTGQPGRPSKWESLERIRDDVRMWSRIGPQADGYSVSFNDAKLCFQLTVSTISYLSNVAARALG